MEDVVSNLVLRIRAEITLSEGTLIGFVGDESDGAMFESDIGERHSTPASFSW